MAKRTKPAPKTSARDAEPDLLDQPAAAPAAKSDTGGGYKIQLGPSASPPGSRLKGGLK